MKATCKKLTVLALVLCLVLSLSVAAMAADLTYYVAGNAELCGEAWNPGAAANLMTLNADGKYEKVFENVPAGTHEFKVTTGAWGNPEWGNGSSNFVLPVDATATVTILFDPVAEKIEALINGAPYVPASGYFVAGAAGLTGLNWSCNAPSGLMEKNADGLYEKIFENIPAGNYELKVTDGTWDNAWGKDGGSSNYIVNVTENGNVKILFNEDTKEITYEVIPTGVQIQNSYTVAGSEGLTGHNWDPSKNPMEKNADGLYQVTFQSIPAGNYEFKVIANANWDTCWGGDGPGGNYLLNVPQSGHVTVLFNEETKEITISIEPAVVEIIYTVAGVEALTGANWDPSQNKMEKNADGLYEITFSDVAAGNHAFKVTNGSWGASWGDNGSDFFVEVAVKSNVTVLFNEETKEITAHVEPLEVPVDPPVDPVDPPVEPENPGTGELIPVKVLTAVMALSACAFLLLKKKAR